MTNNLSKNLAKLAPEAGIHPKTPVTFGYRDFNDFVGRNSESFCADFMACFKAIMNFFTQLIGKAGILK